MDSNNNGIPDSGEVSFHLKSALWGGGLALLIGGAVLTVIGKVAPDNAIVEGVTESFAGGVCDPVKDKLNACEKAIVCYEATIDAPKCVKITK